ncbi:MAG TPA: peptidylprolyl isomerase [Dissulfurispiraceae bacterium]|nr:peptidylprolyl isomerase [Dissulfurispiraceae bacterium]
MGSIFKFLRINVLSAMICMAFLLSVCEGSIVLDKVVAVVNSEVITWSELYKAMEFEASQTVKAMSEQERQKIFKQNEMIFLENLIDMRLLLQEAKKANINASDDEVKKTMESIRTKYGMTDEGLRDALVKEGFTIEEYKKKLAEQIIINRLVDLEVRGKIVITDADANTYLEKNKGAAVDEGYKISHIVIRKGDDPLQAQEKAMQVYGKIKAGESFADAARKYSEDPSARAGGDLGFVNKSDLSREYLQALSPLKPGEMSEPFMTDKGVHIVLLESAKIFNNPSEMKQALKQKLYAERFEREYKAWIKGLRQRAYVEIK